MCLSFYAYSSDKLLGVTLIVLDNQRSLMTFQFSFRSYEPEMSFGTASLRIYVWMWGHMICVSSSSPDSQRMTAWGSVYGSKVLWRCNQNMLHNKLTGPLWSPFFDKTNALKTALPYQLLLLIKAWSGKRQLLPFPLNVLTIVRLLIWDLHVQIQEL